LSGSWKINARKIIPRKIISENFNVEGRKNNPQKCKFLIAWPGLGLGRPKKNDK